MLKHFFSGAPPERSSQSEERAARKQKSEDDGSPHGRSSKRGTKRSPSQRHIGKELSVDRALSEKSAIESQRSSRRTSKDADEGSDFKPEIRKGSNENTSPIVTILSDKSSTAAVSPDASKTSFPGDKTDGNQRPEDTGATSDCSVQVPGEAETDIDRGNGIQKRMGASTTDEISSSSGKKKEYSDPRRTVSAYFPQTHSGDENSQKEAGLRFSVGHDTHILGGIFSYDAFNNRCVNFVAFSRNAHAESAA